jgi:predicted nucleic acid-binding protein
MLLLDTNVISEIRKINSGRADSRVSKWANQQTSTDLYISVITVMELEQGILQRERQDAQQGKILRLWLEQQVLPAFGGRILEIDNAVARTCARLHVPDPRSERDALIAATAIVHGMTVVTRNIRDFEATGVALINPWQGGL